jgi:hypothetical protein
MIEAGDVALRPFQRQGLIAALHKAGAFETIEAIPGLTLPTARFLVEAGYLAVGRNVRGEVGYQITDAGIVAVNPPRRAPVKPS